VVVQLVKRFPEISLSRQRLILLPFHVTPGSMESKNCAIKNSPVNRSNSPGCSTYLNVSKMLKLNEKSDEMAIYGYVRVSSMDQNTDRQLDAMNEIKIPETQIFSDKQSGKDFERPQSERPTG
jgi:hypothetical protein